MTEPIVIRFEATDIDADVSDDLAFLTMETVKDGRVAVYMKRAVFAALIERMWIALEHESSRRPQSD